MASSGTSTRAAATMAKDVAPRFTMRRHRLICGTAADDRLGTDPRTSAGDAPDQQARQRVDDEGYQEQRQADLYQGAEVQVAGSFAKFVGNHAGHGIAGREQRFGNLRSVADDHGHGHGFSQSATQSEDDAADDADARVTQNTNADHLPP